MPINQAPIHEKNVLTPVEIQELLAVAYELLDSGQQTAMAVNAFRTSSLPAGVLMANLSGATHHQVSVEFDSIARTSPEQIMWSNRVTDLARRFTDSGWKRVLGFNFYLPVDGIADAERIEQTPHLDSGISEVFSLQGQGGVRFWPVLGDPYDISCSPGDWCMPGTVKHAGFGQPSIDQPRITAYFYTPGS